MEEERLRPSGIPMVSEDTRRYIFELLDGEPPPGQDQEVSDTHRLLTLLGTEKESNKFELAKSLARLVFRDLAQVNRPLAQGIYDHLAKRHTTYSGGVSGHMMNSDEIGMAVVIKALDKEMDFNLIAKLGQLNTLDDISNFQEALKEVLPEKMDYDSKSILAETLFSPQIPEHQVNLNACVRKVQDSLKGIEGSPLWEEVRLGATGIFNAISKSWEKINPPQQLSSS